jgi:(p)ppGpp synthase/HD superfamily hydrolase
VIIDSTGRTHFDEQSLGFRFEMALLYAFRLHARQKRKGTNTPYLGHLLGVAALVIEAGGTEDEAIAALLHDAVEDQGGKPTLEAISCLFGDRVAYIVEHCSDGVDNPEGRTKANWRERKEAYLKSLHEAPNDVLRVSLADKLYNARAILFDLYQVGDELWRRFNHPKEDQLWYYRSLVSAFRSAPHARDLGALVGELDRIVCAIRDFKTSKHGQPEGSQSDV